eukprot:GILJ01009373.1.p1 GENE.GILJ01009373.1~~GILJ01009373.1.p1  ORF type:complete len:127 (-),score=7.49 GILJ01009373.1:313-693(-)
MVEPYPSSPALTPCANTSQYTTGGRNSQQQQQPFKPPVRGHFLAEADSTAITALVRDSRPHSRTTVTEPIVVSSLVKHQHRPQPVKGEVGLTLCPFGDQTGLGLSTVSTSHARYQQRHFNHHHGVE